MTSTFARVRTLRETAVRRLDPAESSLQERLMKRELQWWRMSDQHDVIALLRATGTEVTPDG